MFKWNHFLSSILKVRSLVFATTNKICTIDDFIHVYTKKTFTSSIRPHTKQRLFVKHCAFLFLCLTSISIIGNRLSAIHFQNSCIRLVGCYTIFNGCQLPWLPSNCHNATIFFMGSDERLFWHFNLIVRFIPHRSSAYQKRPTLIDYYFLKRFQSSKSFFWPI